MEYQGLVVQVVVGGSVAETDQVYQDYSAAAFAFVVNILLPERLEGPVGCYLGSGDFGEDLAPRHIADANSLLVQHDK